MRHIGCFGGRTFDKWFEFGSPARRLDCYRTSALVPLSKTGSQCRLRPAEFIRLFQLDVGVPHPLMHFKLCSGSVLRKKSLLAPGNAQRPEQQRSYQNTSHAQQYSGSALWHSSALDPCAWKRPSRHRQIDSPLGHIAHASVPVHKLGMDDAFGCLKSRGLSDRNRYGVMGPGEA